MIHASTRSPSAHAPFPSHPARRPSARLPVALVAALLAVVTPTIARAGAADPESFPAHWIGGPLTTNRTLTAAAPGPLYFVYGDLTIEPGVTLTIEPGVTLAFADDSDYYTSGSYFDRCELVVRGTLVANGAVGDSILFRSMSSTPNHWGELRVESGHASLSYVRIAGGSGGLVVTGNGPTTTLDHATVSASAYGVTNSGNLHVGSSQVSGAIAGIYASGGSTELVDTQVSGGQFGMKLAGASVRQCVVQGASTIGIDIIGGGVTFLPGDSTTAVPTLVWGCPIGVSVNELSGASGPLELRNLLVYDCGTVGIDVYRTDGVTINYSTVAGSAIGIRSSVSTDTRILNSIVAFNGIAIQLESCAASVDYTDLWQGTSATPACPDSYGPNVAVFDPGFAGGNYHLDTNSPFRDFSVSGGQIGAYGPGNTAVVDVPPARPTVLQPPRAQPNPSRDGRLFMRFAATMPGKARLRVLDLTGRMMREDVVEVREGMAPFDATRGRPLSPGIYFVEMELAGRTSLTKACVMR